MALPEPLSKVPPTPFVELNTASHWLAPCIFKNKSKKALSFQLFNISASRLQQTQGLQTDIEDQVCKPAGLFTLLVITKCILSPLLTQSPPLLPLWIQLNVYIARYYRDLLRKTNSSRYILKTHGFETRRLKDVFFCSSCGRQNYLLRCPDKRISSQTEMKAEHFSGNPLKLI